MVLNMASFISLAEVFLICTNYGRKIGIVTARTMKGHAYHVYCILKNVYKWGWCISKY